MEAPRLEIPADVTPKSFYEELLPRFFQENRARAQSAAPQASQINAAIRAVVEGEGGGTWTLRLSGGDFAVTPNGEGDAVVTFVQTREDWQVTINRGLGALLTKIGSWGSAPPAPPTPGKPSMNLTPAKIERIKAMKVVMKIEITGFEGRSLRLAMLTGASQDGVAPAANITMTAADFNDMVAGKLPIQQAMMGGKVKLTGAGAPFAMQLGLVLMAP